jgi:hypothetical protein
MLGLLLLLLLLMTMMMMRMMLEVSHTLLLRPREGLTILLLLQLLQMIKTIVKEAEIRRHRAAPLSRLRLLVLAQQGSQIQTRNIFSLFLTLRICLHFSSLTTSNTTTISTGS